MVPYCTSCLPIDDVFYCGFRVLHWLNCRPGIGLEYNCKFGAAFHSWTAVGLAAGHDHVMALKADGTVWAWGENHGQLGPHSMQKFSVVPVLMKNLGGVKEIAAGSSHFLVLKSDNTVWAWGDNQEGQLGDGTNLLRRIPVLVKHLPSISQVATGYVHSVALDINGNLFAWGDNAFGALGDGSSPIQTSPQSILGIGAVKAIACGNDRSLAIKHDGTLWEWGAGVGYYQGDKCHSQPVQVQGVSDVSCALVNRNDLFLKNDGKVLFRSKNGLSEITALEDH